MACAHTHTPFFPERENYQAKNCQLQKKPGLVTHAQRARIYRSLLPFLPVFRIESDFSQRQAAIPQRHLTVPEFTKLSPSSFIEVLIKHQLCTKHVLLTSLFSRLFPHPCPMSSQATQPVPTLLGSDFYPEGPMFCTNSYAISSSVYCIISDKLVNARRAKSSGRKKRIGLLTWRGKKDVLAEVKGRQGRRKK
ncbi:hypothetical protein HJG60_010916 [Phyllostomus discolor]|uniref:Uncharacterized protein n=1 Tax=Phyllostomus discolor TaxID=89673 RepID=A0A834EAG0_9CHIR|nr:hypothetical protein HJG60_010916 [Phyllostomus discolor]